MSFPANVYLAAFVSGLAVSFLSLPFWRRWCQRVGLVDDPGHRKIHSAPIPLAGGLAVLTGLALPLLTASALLAADPPFLKALFGPDTAGLFGYGLGRRGLQLAALFAGGLGMLLLGFLDDRHELRPAMKFAGQFAIASLVALAGVRITLFVHSPVFSFAVTVLWILTVTNATNFMDNMNGLCAGLGFIGCWCFGWSAAIHGQFLVTTVALLACGALLGFLPHNFPRARAFLGDSGSHLTGYLLAVLAILPDFYARGEPVLSVAVKPLLILAVILGDLLSVVFIRWQAGRPFYVGDTNHFSHRLARRGLSRERAVLVLWLAAALTGWLAFR